MMLQRHWWLLISSLLTVLLLVGITSGSRPVSAKAFNQYGPQTVTIASACPTMTPVVSLPINPNEIQSITVSGQVNGSFHLHDTAGVFDSIVSGAYAFTTNKSDELDACIIGGGSGTVSFQGQLNINTTGYAGYGVTGFNSSPNSYTDVVGFWQVPSVSCSFGENSESATWIGLGGMLYTGGTKIEQIGTAQACVAGIPSYFPVYENLQSDSLGQQRILSACKGNDVNSCVSTHALVSANDTIEAQVHYYSSSGTFSLIVEDQTKNWYAIEQFQSTDPTLLYSAEWIEEAATDRVTHFSQVNFSQCYVDGHLISGGGPTVDKLSVQKTKSSPIQAQASGLTNGNSFSVQWQHQ